MPSIRPSRRASAGVNYNETNLAKTTEAMDDEHDNAKVQQKRQKTKVAIPNKEMVLKTPSPKSKKRTKRSDESPGVHNDGEDINQSNHNDNENNNDVMDDDDDDDDEEVVIPAAEASRRRREVVEFTAPELGQHLFKLVTSGNKGDIDKAVQDWMYRYEAAIQEENTDVVLLERCSGDLVHFAMRCAGASGPSDTLPGYSASSLPEFVEVMKDRLSTAKTEESLYYQAGPGARRKCVAVGKFWSKIVHKWRNGAVFDTEFMTSLLNTFSQLADSNVRYLRHTFMAACLAIATSLASVVTDVDRELDEQEEALETERNGDNVHLQAELEQSVEELTVKSNILADHLDRLFKMVFMHRYRDTVPAIRQLCIQELGIWMDAFPNKFFNEQYVKYVGWLLNDENGDVRTEALIALIKVCQKLDDTFYDTIQMISQRLAERIIGMTNDAFTAARAKSIELLTILYRRQLISTGDLVPIISSLLDEDHKVRNAAGGLISEVFLSLPDNENETMKKKPKKLSGVNPRPSDDALSRISLRKCIRFVMKHGKSVVVDDESELINEDDRIRVDALGSLNKLWTSDILGDGYDKNSSESKGKGSSATDAIHQMIMAPLMENNYVKPIVDALWTQENPLIQNWKGMTDILLGNASASDDGDMDGDLTDNELTILCQFLCHCAYKAYGSISLPGLTCDIDNLFNDDILIKKSLSRNAADEATRRRAAVSRHLATVIAELLTAFQGDQSKLQILSDLTMYIESEMFATLRLGSVLISTVNQLTSALLTHTSAILFRKLTRSLFFLKGKHSTFDSDISEALNDFGSSLNEELTTAFQNLQDVNFKFSSNKAKADSGVCIAALLDVNLKLWVNIKRVTEVAGYFPLLFSQIELADKVIGELGVFTDSCREEMAKLKAKNMHDVPQSIAARRLRSIQSAIALCYVDVCMQSFAAAVKDINLVTLTSTIMNNYVTIRDKIIKGLCDAFEAGCGVPASVQTSAYFAMTDLALLCFPGMTKQIFASYDGVNSKNLALLKRLQLEPTDDQPYVMSIFEFSEKELLRNHGFDISYCYPRSNKRMTDDKEMDMSVRRRAVIDILCRLLVTGALPSQILCPTLISYFGLHGVLCDDLIRYCLHKMCSLNDNEDNDDDISEAKVFGRQAELIWKTLENGCNVYLKDVTESENNEDDNEDSEVSRKVVAGRALISLSERLASSMFSKDKTKQALYSKTVLYLINKATMLSSMPGNLLLLPIVLPPLVKKLPTNNRRLPLEFLDSELIKERRKLPLNSVESQPYFTYKRAIGLLCNDENFDPFSDANYIEKMNDDNIVDADDDMLVDDKLSELKMDDLQNARRLGTKSDHSKKSKSSNSTKKVTNKKKSVFDDSSGDDNGSNDESDDMDVEDSDDGN